MEKLLFRVAIVWAVVGLAGGVFYREFTKAMGYVGETQLAVVHTHSLVLGFIMMLLILVLERTFVLSKTKSAIWFVWLWTLGVGITVSMLVVNGVLQVNGSPMASGGMVAGIAGLGHLALTAGFVALFMALKQQLRPSKKQA